MRDMLQRENSPVTKSFSTDGFVAVDSFNVCILHITNIKNKSPEWVKRTSVPAVHSSE